MSSFQDLGVFRSQFPQDRMPIGVTCIQRCITRQRERMHVTPSGFYLRVIVNEKPQNRVKTTSSVISVLLIIYDQTPDETNS